MSIEYTIDIQLTELGFPDILQPQGTSDRGTSPHESFPPSHSPASLSASHKQRRLTRDGKEEGAERQPSDAQQTAVLSVAEISQCTQSTLSVQDNPTAGREPAVVDPLTTEQQEGEPKADEPAAQEGTTEARQEKEDDSDDSDVSEVYEEDEEEDDEEEEGLSNESGHSEDSRCSVCDLQLSSKFKLQDHMNLHTGARPYCCAECGKRFCQIYNYRVHLRTHARAKVERLRCRICPLGFQSQEDLKDHLSRTHFEDEFYECDLCKRVFTSLKDCENHVQLHKCTVNVACEVCGRNFSSEKSLRRHQRRVCHRNFKCTDCPKTFSTKNALLKHSFSHLGLLPYTCVRCRCHFRLATLYRQHKCVPERIHCVACLREFLNQGDFQQHKKDTGCWGNQEPNETPDEIRCLECGQIFDTSEELKNHAGAHQRVLKCAECGKGFRSALLLMSHMGGHAGQSPCLCQSCGLGFPHQQNYDSHLKTCGQTSQPANAPKKRQTSRSSLPQTKMLKEEPNSAANTAAAPAAVSNDPAAPVKDSSSPELLTGGVSADSGPSAGLWKLTLDKSMNLVFFLPVCASESNGLPSAVPQTLRVPTMQALPQAALSPALGAPLDAPLDLCTGIKQDTEAPLDLSKKCSSSDSVMTNIPLLPVKHEPEEVEISGQDNGTDGQELKNHDSKVIVETNAEQTDLYAEGKQLKIDPAVNAQTAPSGPVVDIKKESRSPGPEFDWCSSTWSQLADKRPKDNIKMEVDMEK
ncbi:zinc finger protein 668 [Embiotoca jacksoni]|uniref:zinc finger protein 668 n=1 Tax=Embiotoca jacksoni TaxID=100190 RepID=UPI003703D5B3